MSADLSSWLCIFFRPRLVGFILASLSKKLNDLEARLAAL